LLALKFENIYAGELPHWRFFHQSIRKIPLNITHTEIQPLTSEITLHLAPEDYKEQVMKTLKEHAKKANLPGFRPGKVPMGMIKKMVGKSVLIEELNQIIQKELFDYIEKEKLDILGNPIPKDTKSEDYFDLGLNKELEFTFEVGLAPEIELQWDKLEAIEDYEIEIDEEYLEKELENQRERHAEVTNPEEVQEGDIIYGKLEEIDDQEQLVEEGYERMIVLIPHA